MPDEKEHFQRQILLQQVEILLEDGNPKKLKELLDEQRSVIFDVLEKAVSAEVLEKVDEATLAGLFQMLKEDEIKNLISELDHDDAADLLA